MPMEVIALADSLDLLVEVALSGDAGGTFKGETAILNGERCAQNALVMLLYPHTNAGILQDHRKSLTGAANIWWPLVCSRGIEVYLGFQAYVAQG
jgi:hypothetical protein